MCTNFLFKIKGIDNYNNIQISAVFKFFSSNILEMHKPTFCLKSMVIIFLILKFLIIKNNCLIYKII